MANKMLIDASHPEETRVVALRGNRVEDFDFESASKKPLRGNIYLAKVTRVEPSLQAAFIEYGGNRHGFLAFSEIHPDYYQIPVADRQALLDEEARAHREEEEEPRSGGNGRRSRRRGRGPQPSEKRADLGDERLAEPIDQGGLAAEEASDAEPEAYRAEAVAPEDAVAGMVEAQVDDQDPILPFQTLAETGGNHAEEALLTAGDEQGSFVSETAEDAVEHDSPTELAGGYRETDAERDEGVPSLSETDEDPDLAAPSDENGHGDEEEEESVEQLGGDAMEDATYRAPRLRRHYKIQEVIKRRQILLVQVVKEERGNKGAALTTYLSLAGRYSVLMPNTARGGGISRKITDSDDRRRLKAIAQELDVPEGMGIILRTAGAARGETEVKRDFEYLLRMWETVRELTLTSSAPKLVYEEGSLIKRAIRDLYSKEVDEIWVSGEAGYREAKDYMRLLMPTHAKNVQLYKDPQPIFAKGGAEAQLDAMFSNHVTLKSGGYIVINQTEALVAIDVNSGRSTREHNIEDTALRTNLEAADEVARQLRLRDLAGLIVVDFIDMEEGRNNRAVERRIKDALKNDRARIQIGRISHFGLLEMSRQRIRTGVLEGSTVICPHCAGAGTVRSTSSIALHVLRVLEDTLIRSASHNLIVRTRIEVALYVLNQKRANLSDLEQRFGVTIVVMADAALTGTVYHAIERGELATPAPVFGGRQPVSDQDEEADSADEDLDGEIDEEDADIDADSVQAREDGHRNRSGGEESGDQGERRRKRRRRRRGRDRDQHGVELAPQSGQAPDGDVEEFAEGLSDDLDVAVAENEGGARVEQDATIEPIADEIAPAGPVESDAGADEVQPNVAEPQRQRRTRRPPGRASAASAEARPSPQTSRQGSTGEDGTAGPRRSRRSRARPVEPETPSLLSFEAPSADRDVGADTAQNHPAGTDPASNLESTEPQGLMDLSLEAGAPEVGADPDPVQTAPVIEQAPAPDEPPRAKRSGWWQRAKATLTGE